jgi:hypothetical protein
MVMVGMTAMATMVSACGKKGPPLAPLRLVPSAVSEVTVRRVGGEVQLRFKLPTANANGPGRIDLDRVEIYAVTVAPGSVTPPNRDLLTKTYVVGTIAVKPPPIEGNEDEPAEGAPPDTRPSPGDEVSFVEELTEARMTPAPLPKAPPPVAAPPSVPALPPVTPLVLDMTLPAVAPLPGTTPLAPVPPIPGPATAAAATPMTGAGQPTAASQPAAPPVAPVQTTIVRVYAIRGLAASGRPGQPSTRMTVPLVPPPLPPTAPKATFTEKAVVVEWTPPAAEGTGSALTFNVYRSKGHGGTAAKPDAEKPATAVKPEAALNSSPLAAGRLELPVGELGTEQCFAVRSVALVQNVAFESEASPTACVMPRDIFPPAAPQGLSLLLLDGAIELVWDASVEPDIAGYTVLRGDAPGDTLRPLTPAPIRETTFRDTSVRSGAHYIYAIVAVDRAGNPSQQSARVEGTAR